MGSAIGGPKTVTRGEAIKRLKSAVALDEGGECCSDMMLNIEKAFQAWDKNGDGQISMHELVSVLKELGMKLQSDGDVVRLMEGIDCTGDNQIDYKEFISWLWAPPALDYYFTQLFMLHVRERDQRPLDKPHLQALKDSLVPHIEKFFDWHDDHKTGVLTEKQSILFTANYVYEQEKQFETMFNCFREMQDKTHAQQSSVKSFVPLQEDFMNELFEHVSEYEKQRHTLHHEAFQIIDRTGDCLLQRGEVVTALMPHTEFTKKFGMWSTPLTMAMLRHAGCDSAEKAAKRNNLPKHKLCRRHTGIVQAIEQLSGLE